MKKVLLVLILLIFSHQSYSQDIVLTFDGVVESTGTNATLDRVVIENLTRGGFVELTSSFVFNLTGALEIQDVELKSNKPGFQKVYPNPFTDSVNLEFYSEGVGTTTVNFYNLLGQQTARFSEKLNKGVHKLKFAPNASGVYLISLNDNGKNYFNKVIASQSNNNQKILSYIPNVSPSITAKNNSKAKVNSFFAEGDALKYTAYSGSLIDVIYDSPTVSKTVTFEFADAYYRFEPYFIESNFPSFVDIMFSVTDANNKGVDYLDNPDFDVLENGSPVSPTETFRYVKKLDQVPYFQKTVIMLDNSSSVAVNLTQIKAAAISLVNKIVADQEIAIYSFSDNAVLLQDFTSNVADLEAAINGITTGFPSTNLYGSLITGLDSFTNLYSLDRIEEGYLIALTDGDDTQGSSTLQQVIDARGKKRVFIAGLGNELNPAPLMQITSTGNYFPVTTAAELDANFNQIWLDILQYSNSFYWLNYMTPKRTGTHDLTVEALNNTNINSDKNITGTFPADGFQSVFSGVYANISPAKPYGVDWVVLVNSMPGIDLKAVTYWAQDVPDYSWNLIDASIGSLNLNQFDNSKMEISTNNPNKYLFTQLTLSDIVNGYTKDIDVYTGDFNVGVKSLPATLVAAHSAQVNALFVPAADDDPTITIRQIYVSKVEGGASIANFIDYEGPGKLSHSIVGLTQNTEYSVRAGVGYGGPILYDYSTFTTGPDVPIVNTNSVATNSNDFTSLNVSGKLLNDGGVTGTKGFVWDTNPNPTIALPTKIINTNNLDASLNYNSTITGLTAGITYYVKAFATNSYGTVYGDEIIQTTPAFEVPALTTKAITSIGQLSATSGGDITNDFTKTILEKGIVWSTSPNPTTTLNSKTADGQGDGSFISNITPLNYGTTYYVRAYAINEIGTGYGNELIFTTLPGIPILTTSAITNITSPGATSGGNITFDGGSTVTSRGICWSSSPNPTISSELTNCGQGTGNFICNITGVDGNYPPGITIYIRAYATNNVGTAYGNELSLTTVSENCGNITDYDGNIYPTTTIGAQCWTTKNLDVSHYRNGDPIPQVTDPTEWKNITTGALCYYENNTANGPVYGKLYNWYAVIDPRGLAPVGWHIPNVNEWITFVDYLGGETLAGGKLKETGTTHWLSPNTGASNIRDFTALPGGYRTWDGFFTNIGAHAEFWSSSPATSTSATRFQIWYNINLMDRNYELRNFGFSVRCVRD